MKASELFKRYVWLVDTIRRAGHISMHNINSLWVQTTLSDGVPFSRSTFRRQRQEVEDLFGISIKCDNENRYYIDDTSLMSSDSVTRWMLSTLAVSNIVSEARGLHNRILLESIPTEGEHLQQAVESMQNSHRIIIQYRRYGSDEPKQWTVEPYCIKLFRRRWYLLGRFENGGFIVLSFDRILQMQTSDESFTIDKHFDAQTYFAEYFGVMTDSRTPLQHIVLRAFGNERYALRDLPLHSSQKVIAEGADYVDFEVHLRPTSDFLAHILSRGRWLKVISPDDIAQRIKYLLQESLEEYK